MTTDLFNHLWQSTVCAGVVALLSLSLPNRLLQVANVVQRQFSRLDELLHHRLRSAAEEAQDGVEEPVPRDVTGDQRLEDVRVADLARPAQRALRLESVHRRLHGGVRGTRLGKPLLDLANRRVAAGPQDLQNLQLKAAELGWCLRHLLFCGHNYYSVVDEGRWKLVGWVGGIYFAGIPAIRGA